MIDWFGERYTDPVHELPYNSREGGYQWLYGGPVSADEVIQHTFSEVASFEVMREAIERIEEDGFDWTPVRENELDDGTYSVAEPFPDLSDMGIDEDDTKSEIESLRQEMNSRLDRVEELILSKWPVKIGLGHNNPPEPMEVELPSEIILSAILDTVHDARKEAYSPNPDLEIAKSASGKLSAAANAIAKWIADRANAQLDSAVSVAIGSAIVVNAEKLAHALAQAAQATMDWISALNFPF